MVHFLQWKCLWKNHFLNYQQIGFNGGVPITEEFYVKNYAGRHNDDAAAILFPDDHEKGVKFLHDKEATFRRWPKPSPNFAILF